MPQLTKTKVKAIYHANFNGISLFDESDGNQDLPYSNFDEDSVLGVLGDKCNDDGRFYGDEDEAEELIIREVKASFGNDIEVVVEFDRIST